MSFGWIKSVYILNFCLSYNLKKRLALPLIKRISSYSSDGSGSKNFDPGRVGSAIYGLGLNLENFPLKLQIFQFFSLRIKKNLFRLAQKVPGLKAGRPFIYCRSKVSSGHMSLLYLVLMYGRYWRINNWLDRNFMIAPLSTKAWYHGVWIGSLIWGATHLSSLWT